MSETTKEKEEAIQRLREWLKPGDCIYTILRHVSRSGMQREISLRKIDTPAERELHGRVSGSFIDLDGNVALALGERIGKHDGVVVGGCGMDMGAALVYDLSVTLFRDGFGCIGEGCPSNDHSNGDRDYTPHMSIPERTNDAGELCRCHRTHWHAEGGYALRQRWM